MPRKLLLLAVASLLSLAAVEVALRVAARVTRVDHVVPQAIGRFDADLGWSLEPGSRATSSRTGEPVLYRINSDGLRNDEIVRPKPRGTFRIVLLGDSRTFGYGNRIEDHFSSLLEGYLEGVEVINMGVSGFGVDQELLLLRDRGFDFEPDLVLAYVAHYAEHRHMHTNRFGKNKPRFALRDGALRLTGRPVPANEKTRAGGALRRAHWWMAERVKVYATARGLLVRALREQKPSTRERRVQEDERDLEDPAFASELHRLGAAIVRAMHDDCTERGVRFGLVTPIPSLLAMAGEHDIPVLDVGEALDNPRLAISEELGHLNGAGNGVLAWEIARFLERGLGGSEVIRRRSL